MKKKNLALSVLAPLAIVGLASCTGDARYPRSFTVHFVTGETGEKIADQTVKEGYTIKGVSDPGNSREHIFRGWYLDEEYKELFDVETYRVFEDITLYAKWTFPSKDPQEIELGSDAFTHSITWVQKDVDPASDDIVVKAYKGELVYHYSYNEDYDKYVVDGTEIAYDMGVEPTVVEGTLKTDGQYQVTFTLDNPGTDYYKFMISSKSSSFVTGEAEDIHFKGDGTESNPYLVYNENDLTYLSTQNFEHNYVYAKLMNDITVSSVYGDKGNSKFYGHLTGSKSNALILSNDTYAITLKNNSGLFNVLCEGSIVEDVTFRGSLSGSNPSIGVVANYNYGLIRRVNSQAMSVKSQGGKVNDLSSASKGGSGGIVGTNYGEITDCTVSSARDNVIQGNIAVGCVAGINYGSIHDMKVDGIVGAYNGNEISLTIANSFAGVVAGINYGTISKIDVYNGKINCRRMDLGAEGEGASNVGGVVGYNATTGVVDQCTFDGMRIVGDTNVGGIAGYNDGEIKNCYTGRRLRKPSNTAVEERQFISPVIGSYNVGGIVGKCGENSNVHNVFSTANVWSYRMAGYSVAEKADNAIAIMHNCQPRLSSNYLGQKYGVVYSNDLKAPTGTNTLAVDNTSMIGTATSWGLGFVKDESGVLVADIDLAKGYLAILGDAFGFRNSSSHGIRLCWESSSVEPLKDMGA